MLYNFMPFSKKVQNRKNNPKKTCRFEELNGFVYYSNWLENMSIAGSMNGFKQFHKKRQNQETFNRTVKELKCG